MTSSFKRRANGALGVALMLGLTVLAAPAQNRNRGPSRRDE